MVCKGCDPKRKKILDVYLKKLKREFKKIDCEAVMEFDYTNPRDNPEYYPGLN